MPDATVVSGMNADPELTSPFGQYILSQMQSNDSGFLQFIATGFDPRKDLLEIVAATPATGLRPRIPALILGRGVFQPAMIIGAATAGGRRHYELSRLHLIGPPAGQVGARILP